MGVFPLRSWLKGILVSSFFVSVFSGRIVKEPMLSVLAFLPRFYIEIDSRFVVMEVDIC